MRARVNSEWLTEGMYKQIESTIKRMIEAGDLVNPHNRPLFELLEAWQCLNGDEIGFDPEGKWARMECFDQTKQPMVQRSCEKALFWVTVFFVL
jgi:hypothetical protein